MEPAFRLDPTAPESGVQYRAPVRAISAAPQSAEHPTTTLLESVASVALVLLTIAVASAWFAALAPAGGAARTNVHAPR
jgi:hypothetical protein